MASLLCFHDYQAINNVTTLLSVDILYGSYLIQFLGHTFPKTTETRGMMNDVVTYFKALLRRITQHNPFRIMENLKVIGLGRASEQADIPIPLDRLNEHFVKDPTLNNTTIQDTVCLTQLPQLETSSILPTSLLLT
ncbi:hypothetical protein ANN_14993 [Periplaneta americana]|uniref:Uncharacterized protein n=1 Tax=Periplaneta americana TaxID=6978 RepID=A0ABQ8SZF9_PERAM|nr:hypothetical protein ANN_14993 [Periplaneta americana]